MSIEVKAADLQAGDVIVAKHGGAKFTVTRLVPGMGGPRYPYLILADSDGKTVEHDTAFDSYPATYTVERN